MEAVHSAAATMMWRILQLRWTSYRAPQVGRTARVRIVTTVIGTKYTDRRSHSELMVVVRRSAPCTRRSDKRLAT